MSDWKIDSSAFNPTETTLPTVSNVYPIVPAVETPSIASSIGLDTTASALPATSYYIPDPSKVSPTVLSNMYRVYPMLPQGTVPFNQTTVGGFLQKHGYNSDLLQKTYDEYQGIKQGLAQQNALTKIGYGLSAIQTALGAYQGYKQLKLANKQFEHAKMESERNYQSQRKMVNSKLEDRQARRVAEANVNGHQATSVADYMKQYGV